MTHEEARALGQGLAAGIAERIGELTYAAYSKAANGLTFDGKPMPTWEALGPEVQKRWGVAGMAASLATMKTIQGVRHAAQRI